MINNGEEQNMQDVAKLTNNILSDITVYMKYARYIPEIQRRETWEELVERNMVMHIRKYPEIKEEIKQVYKDYVFNKKVLPSMRSLQFSGKPIETAPSRIYNCAYLPVDSIYSFSEAMFLLLGGTGCGYSVQRHHVEKLPAIKGTLKTKRRFLVSDNIEGWADCIKVLMEAYFHGKSEPVFDYRDIRPKGAMLVTSGGKAPGPQPLKDAVHNIRKVLDTKPVGSKLTTLEAHDIMCFIADAVLAGGIRRAALISLFNMDDDDMLTCKHGSWWELNPQRGRANNSAVILRHKVTKGDFDSLWEKVVASGSGEPGVYFSNDKDWGTNPCCFAGETQLLTSEGYKRLDELVGVDFDNVNKDGNTSKGKVWSNGIKEVVELRFVKKKPITCTPDHTFMDAEGNSVEAKDLKGKRLMPYYAVKSVPEDVTAFKAGFILGDGMLGRLESSSHKGLEVCIGAKDLEVGEYFGVHTAGNHYLREAYDIATAYGLKGVTTPTRELPEKVSSDFMMGLYSANGCVIKGAKRVALKTASRLMADQVCEWLSNVGMTPYVTTNKSKSVAFSNGVYVCKESYDVNLCGIDNLTLFARSVSFVHEHKRKALEDAILNSAPMVVGVKTKGSTEVFDFNEPEVHWGVVEGVVVHNCEIGLRPYQFCNLCELNVSDIESQEDLNNRAKAAAFIGTLQAGYTDFHYLRDIWKSTTEKDALIGVGMTGVGSGVILNYDLKQAAKAVVDENKRVAGLIGINSAARTTTIKPSGTSSLVLGCSSGVHAWHNDYYIRRIRVGKNESIYGYLAEHHPALVEDEYFRPKEQAVIQVPQAAPEGSILRTESPMHLLERVKVLNLDWVKTGHKKGQNTHNVSCTISVKDEEWAEVGEWMWENRNNFNGISVLPYDGGTYIQAPFEDITKDKFEEMLTHLTNVDLSKIVEIDDNTNLSGEIACGAGGCTVV